MGKKKVTGKRGVTIYCCVGMGSAETDEGDARSALEDGGMAGAELVKEDEEETGAFQWGCEWKDWLLLKEVEWDEAAATEVPIPVARELTAREETEE